MPAANIPPMASTLGPSALEVNLRRLMVKCDAKVRGSDNILQGLDRAKYMMNIRVLREMLADLEDDLKAKHGENTDTAALRKYAEKIDSLASTIEGPSIMPSSKNLLQTRMIPSPTVTNVITTGTFSNNLRRVSQTPSEKSARDAAHRVVLGRQESSSVSRTDELLGLRERRSGGDTKQSTLGISDTRDTVRNQGEIEAALQNDRTQREEMEAGLSVLMQQLRHNAMAIHQTLADERSSGYLDDADQALDTNISRLGKERTRLELYSKQSRKTKWMIWGIVLAVSMVFVFMFFIIRIF